MTATPSHPRIAFLGPMLGGNPGWVPSQGEILGRWLEEDGWSVRLASRHPGRAARLTDTLTSLARWRRDLDLAVVLVFGGAGFAMADATSLAVRTLGLPLVLWLHGGGLPELGERRPRWVRRVLARGAARVAPSPFLASWVEGLDLPIRVIPNGLEVDSYPHRVRRELPGGDDGAHGPRLLWMRTFHPLYQPELAVEVARRLLPRYPGLTLTLAGQEKAPQGPGSLAAVRAAAERAGLGERVRFPGFLDEAAKRRELATHDLYLHTNRVDNTPVSVLEAAAAGLPVVALRVGGIPHLLRDGETALLADPTGDHDHTAAGLTAAVTRLLEDPDLAETLSRAGHSLAEASDRSVVVPAWRRLAAEVSS